MTYDHDQDEAPATVEVFCRKCRRTVEVDEEEAGLYWAPSTLCPSCADREWEKCHD